MPASSTVTAVYRARLARMDARLLRALAQLWVRLFNPADPSGSLTLIGAAAGQWVTAGQAAAAAETVNYLRALYSVGAGQPYTEVDPFTVPAGLVGSAASGTDVGSMTGQAPAVYWARIGAGQSAQLAEQASLAWLNRLAGSEPYRVANTTTIANTVGDDRFTGRVVRITRPDACPFCVQIADRGYTPAHAGFAAHAHCHCTPAPQISSRARSRRAVRRGRAAVNQGGTNP